MSHHTEAFLDDRGLWGWQCLDPECGKEATGFADCYTAEGFADRHEREGVHAVSLQSELDRLEREDPAVQAASDRLDAVGEYIKGCLPSSAVKAIYDLTKAVRDTSQLRQSDFILTPSQPDTHPDHSEPVLRDPFDMDDDERRL